MTTPRSQSVPIAIGTTLRGCTGPTGEHVFPTGQGIPPNAPCLSCGEQPTSALGLPSDAAGALRWPDPPDLAHYASVEGRCSRRFCAACRRIRAAIESGLVVDPFAREERA